MIIFAIFTVHFFKFWSAFNGLFISEKNSFKNSFSVIKIQIMQRMIDNTKSTA